jgi:hypothetical protein
MMAYQSYSAVHLLFFLLIHPLVESLAHTEKIKEEKNLHTHTSKHIHTEDVYLYFKIKYLLVLALHHVSLAGLW